MNTSHLARSTIRQLIELGVSNFVLSPGSRNAPLSLALNEASEKGLIDLHVKIDVAISDSRSAIVPRPQA